MYLKIGRCEFCGALLVVMDTHTGSVLPVEVKDKNTLIEATEIFDSQKFISHLLNCIQQRDVWEKKKIKYIKQRNPFAKLPKNLAD